MKFTKKLLIPLSAIVATGAVVAPMVTLVSCANNQVKSWDFAKGYYNPEWLPQVTVSDASTVKDLGKKYFEADKANVKIMNEDILCSFNEIAYDYLEENDQLFANQNDSFVVAPNITKIDNIDVAGELATARVSGTLDIKVKSDLAPINIHLGLTDMKINFDKNEDEWEAWLGYDDITQLWADQTWKLNFSYDIGKSHQEFTLDHNSQNKPEATTILAFCDNFSEFDLATLTYTYLKNEAVSFEFKPGQVYTPTYVPVQRTIPAAECIEYYSDILMNPDTGDKTIFAQDILYDLNGIAEEYSFQGKILVSLYELDKETTEDSFRISYDIVFDGNIEGEKVLGSIEMRDLKFNVFQNSAAGQDENPWYSAPNYQYNAETEQYDIWEDITYDSETYLAVSNWSMNVISLSAGGKDDFYEIYDALDGDVFLDKLLVELILSLSYTDELYSLSKVTPQA